MNLTENWKIGMISLLDSMRVKKECKIKKAMMQIFEIDYLADKLKTFDDIDDKIKLKIIEDLEIKLDEWGLIFKNSEVMER